MKKQMEGWDKLGAGFGGSRKSHGPISGVPNYVVGENFHLSIEVDLEKFTVLGIQDSMGPEKAIAFRLTIPEEALQDFLRVARRWCKKPEEKGGKD